MGNLIRRGATPLTIQHIMETMDDWIAFLRKAVLDAQEADPDMRVSDRQR